MGLVAYLLWHLRDRVRPGVVFALYCLLSGFERFLVEFIRRNKEVLFGLTAPQLESVVLMIVGAVWLSLMMRGGRGLSGLRAEGCLGWVRRRLRAGASRHAACFQSARCIASLYLRSSSSSLTRGRRQRDNQGRDGDETTTA